MRSAKARASALLVAVERFIREEAKHARAVEAHAKTRPDGRDLSHSRDDVDLAHADLVQDFTAADCRLARRLIREGKAP